MKEQVHCVIKGQVQGVNFRSKTKRHADGLSLKGYVRNLSDGNVEIVVMGTKKEAEALISALRKEPPPISIETVVMTTSLVESPYPSFIVKTDLGDV